MLDDMFGNGVCMHVYLYVIMYVCVFFLYCNHFGGWDLTLTVGDSSPSLGKMEPRPGRKIIPSES